MRPAVLAKSLRGRRRAAAGCGLGLAALAAWLGAVFPILAESDAFAGFVENLPPALLAAAGIDSAVYLTGAGFLSAYLFSMFAPLLMLVFTIGAATAETAAEERGGLLDMVLSAPVSRNRVLLEKAAAVGLAALAQAAVLTGALLAANAFFGMSLTVAGVAAAGLALWLLGVCFGAAALLAAAVFGRPAAAGGAAGLLAFLAWFVESFSGLYPWLGALAAASPFTWYSTPGPLLEGLGAGHLWLAASTAALTAAAAWVFRRRDLAAGRTPLRAEAAGRRRRPRIRRPRAARLLSGPFGKTLWDRRRSVWGWGGGLALLTLFMFSTWPALSEDAEAMAGLISALPGEVFALFGISNPESMVTAAGYLSSRTYQVIGPILIVLFTVRGVSSGFIREEKAGVLDLVLAAPAPRRRVLAAKAGGTALSAALVAAAPTGAALAGDAVWNTGLGASRILAAGAGLGLLGLFFGGLALLIWTMTGRSFSAVRITAAAAFGTFLLNGLGALTDGMAPLRLLSPFYWYLGDAPPLAKGFEPSYLLLLFGALAATWAASVRFHRRDLAV